MSNPWFRMYSEFASDPKVQSMSEQMQRRLLMLLCLRCADALPGLSDEEIAVALRISPEDVTETKSLFVTKRFVDANWRVTNWNKRQFKADTSAERTRRYRENLVTSHPRHGDVTVTPSDADTEQMQNRVEKTSCSSGDERSRKQPVPINSNRKNFDTFWESVWRKTGKDAAWKAYERRIKQGIKPEILLGAAIAQGPYLSLNSSPIHPTTWLNQGRYLDEEEAYRPRDGPKSVQKSMFVDRNAQQDQKFLERMQREYERQVQH